MDSNKNGSSQQPVNTTPIEETAPTWLAQNGITLAILAALIGLMVYKSVDLTVVGILLVGLGFVIFIHELGHFVAAKWCDVHVETFSIGFGPSLPYCHYKWGETTYKIGLIPLGGYVKMLGEGTESEEGEEDPRSFKNKSVGQRMVIISAGVIMNMLFAVAGFIGVFMGPGTERVAAIIGQIDPGSPAWQAGLPSGSLLTRVAGMENPYFEQVRPAIALSRKGVAIPITYISAEKHKPVDLDIEPRFEGDKLGLRVIGIAPSTTTKMRAFPRQKIPAYIPGSAAANCNPPIQNNDMIVATTEAGKPGEELVPLPLDFRYPDGHRPDYFAWHQRLVDSAGQPMKVLVEREVQTQSEQTTTEKVIVNVPPAFNHNLGLIMRMGPVFAVRSGGPAANALVQSKIANTDADLIESVEVTETGGGIIRFTNARSPQPTAGVTEKPLDPVRLPLELSQWAAKAAEPKKVKVSVLRPSGHDEKKKTELELTWDDSWKYSRESPLSSRSPMSIPGLGLSYRVETVVEDVVKGSVAEQGGIKSNDIIAAVRWYHDEKLEDGEKAELKDDEWAFVAHILQSSVNTERIDLFVKRAGANQVTEVKLSPPEDKSWPVIARGFRFDTDMWHQHADSPMAAIGMGNRQVMDTAINVYLSLDRMVRGDISFFKNATGPIGIAMASYNIAGESLIRFLLFLCVLSVNLAVLNFLPIPVLDGGHMIFLMYEKARGRPMPEVVRTAATFAGMALLLSLMICVIFLDVWKLVK